MRHSTKSSPKKPLCLSFLSFRNLVSFSINPQRENLLNFDFVSFARMASGGAAVE